MRGFKLVVLSMAISLSGCCSDYTLKGYSYDRRVYFSLFKKQTEVKKGEQEKMPGYLAIRIYNQRYLPALSEEKSGGSVEK